MFPRLEKSYRIINESNPCNQRSKAEEGDFRQLMIRSPILNDRTCYVSSCHAHTETQDILGSLIIKMPLHQIDTSIAESTRDFFMLAAASTLLLVFVLIYFTHQKIKHPLKAILTASEGVARGNDSMRLEIKPDLLDDMRVVSLAFNNMLDKLNIANEALKEWSEQLEFKVEEKTAELSQIQGELIHIEKMASLGKLSSSVAHEINNPLTGVLTFTKLVHKQLKKETLPGETKMMMLKYLTIIEDETKRCGGIVNGLLDFSQKHQDDFQNKSLNTILKNTYELMQHQMKLANINFTQDCKAKADLIFCNENQIKQACVAMLVNAREAIAVSGNISIESENPDNQHILIRISDTGIGIKQELIKHIFEPFFSAKSKANSIGLGLSIVHGIVENHKGKIEVHSQLGSGTSLSILFPLVV
jgi:two-component system NtrC family sensor kinase